MSTQMFHVARANTKAEKEGKNAMQMVFSILTLQMIIRYGIKLTRFVLFMKKVMTVFKL